MRSWVPEGKGVSSSAAVEVAAMQAICAAVGISLPGSQCALLCQQVRHRPVYMQVQVRSCKWCVVAARMVAAARPEQAPGHS